MNFLLLYTVVTPSPTDEPVAQWEVITARLGEPRGWPGSQNLAAPIWLQFLLQESW